MELEMEVQQLELSVSAPQAYNTNSTRIRAGIWITLGCSPYLLGVFISVGNLKFVLGKEIGETLFFFVCLILIRPQKCQLYYSYQLSLEVKAR